jgi:hypothetical protein
MLLAVKLSGQTVGPRHSCVFGGVCVVALMCGPMRPVVRDTAQTLPATSMGGVAWIVDRNEVATAGVDDAVRLKSYRGHEYMGQHNAQRRELTCRYRDRLLPHYCMYRSITFYRHAEQRQRHDRA